MGYDLAKLKDTNTDVAVTDNSCDLMEQGGAFLPFVRFCVGQTKAVQKGHIGINRYGLFQGQDVTDLGPEIDVAVLERRAKAMDTSGEDIITCFDMKVVDGQPTGEFKRIMDQSGVKDSGCMFGTEYLIYIGGDVKQFATIHFASITARNESKKMTARKGSFATLKFEEIVTKKFEYNAIKVLACSDGFGLPEEAEVLKQLDDFKNPKSSEVEGVTVSAEAAEAGGRAR